MMRSSSLLVAAAAAAALLLSVSVAVTATSTPPPISLYPQGPHPAPEPEAAAETAAAAAARAPKLMKMRDLPDMGTMMRNDANFTAWLANLPSYANVSRNHFDTSVYVPYGRVAIGTRMTIIDYWPKTIGYLGDFITIVGTNFDQNDMSWLSGQSTDIRNVDIGTIAYQKIKCTAKYFDDSWAIPVRQALNDISTGLSGNTNTNWFIRNDIIICPRGKGQVGTIGDTSAVRNFPLHVWLDVDQTNTMAIHSSPGITQDDNILPSVTAMYIERYEYDYLDFDYDRVTSMDILRCQNTDEWPENYPQWPWNAQFAVIAGNNLGVRRSDMNYLALGSPPVYGWSPSNVDYGLAPMSSTLYNNGELIPVSSSVHNIIATWGQANNFVLGMIRKSGRPAANFGRQTLFWGWGGAGSGAYTPWLAPGGIGVDAINGYLTCPVSGQRQ